MKSIVLILVGLAIAASISADETLDPRGLYIAQLDGEEIWLAVSDGPNNSNQLGGLRITFLYYHYTTEFESPKTDDNRYTIPDSSSELELVFNGDGFTYTVYGVSYQLGRVSGRPGDFEGRFFDADEEYADLLQVKASGDGYTFQIISMDVDLDLVASPVGPYAYQTIGPLGESIRFQIVDSGVEIDSPGELPLLFQNIDRWETSIRKAE